MTNPIWVSLIVGLLGGIGSALLTQLLASRREAAAQSYEHRRNAYGDFIKEFQHMHKEFTRDDDEASGDYLDALYDRLIQIQIFGTKRVTQPADKAYNILVNWAYGDEEIIPEAEDLLESLQRQIRRDLSIPN
jgi:hypothetical protein